MAAFNCVMVGDESLLVECARLVLARGHTISAIVSANSSVRQWARGEGIEALQWQGDLASVLGNTSYDWLFSVANLRMIPHAVWAGANRGAINFHDGPLPHYAGLNTPSWALLAGEEQHGVTWHAITDGIDEGAIYAQEMFALEADDTALTLNTKCFEAGIASFARVLVALEDGVQPVAQDFTNRQLFARSKRPVAAGTLDFDQGAQALSQTVRALSFGAGYRNPLSTAKLQTGRGLLTVQTLTVLDEALPGLPGEVLDLRADAAVIATADKPVLVTAQCAGGLPVTQFLRKGDLLPRINADESASLTVATEAAATHEAFFRKAIASAADLDIPGIAAPSVQADIRSLDLAAPADGGMAVAAAFLRRIGGEPAFDVAFVHAGIASLASEFPEYFSPSVPLRIESADNATVAEFVSGFAQRVAALKERGVFAADLVQRTPGLSPARLAIAISENGQAVQGTALTFAFNTSGGQLFYDANRVSHNKAQELAHRFGIFAAGFADDAAMLSLPLMDEAEKNRVLFEWNRSERDYDRQATMHSLIELQVDRTPDLVAVADSAGQLTYRQLDERANRIAHALQAAGIGPDVLVGLHLPRGMDLVTGGLAIHKAGGAYVPLDPAFPADRLALMIEDSAAPVVLTDRSLANSPALAGVRVMVIEDVLAQDWPATRPTSGSTSSNLAYVIFTSGSTGRPKGVMVEHGNAANFFAGMDDRIAGVDGPDQPVWLAVTSLSFDISVLELFWTLTRGFKVVVYSAAAAASQRLTGTLKALDFGLFYWGNDDGAGPAKYRLLLEGAKFADEHGFQSIWTPERHFHAFGGPYPNPAVTGAAVASITKNLAIRAGSCVLPLHHPLRVAEEWSVLDNLSNGRVGLAFASGWMPEDFVLRPENTPPNNKAAMLRDIETVRRLWRGEAVEFDFGSGKAAVVTQPRPVQKELPVWITTAGNPETYRDAARAGANVLTHLLGQSVAELGDKIRIYRETLRECGHDPSAFKVTLMLHTLVGTDREVVRQQAREPLKEYLRSAAALIKQYAWAFPAFKKPQGATNAMDIDLRSLDQDEVDAILDFAFQRYFEDSGLFGTVEDAARRLDEIAAVGVDDVACLIDFGVNSDTVLQSLPHLADVVARNRAPQAEASEAESFASLIARHGVTHLQCTPSMARMFLDSDENRSALARVRHLFIGGEALHSSLLGDIAAVSSASVENMYGPTETTIWSSTLTANQSEGVVPLGKPIANTQLYALDVAGQPVPPGFPGELYIGGEGVTRGYIQRPDLTAERFVQDPFTGRRMYRTGDLVSFSADGTLNFLGRADHQVKVRGYRIELGEIESRLAALPGIVEAVVMAREDRKDDVRIVAYMRVEGEAPADETLRTELTRDLPDYMIPAHFLTLDAFPLTPNAKVDRKQLPRPEDAKAPASTQSYVAPDNSTQQAVVETFQRILGVERVGLSDSFFALGGHSLLAVQAHRELKASVAPALTITDLFRFPTAGALAAHIDGDSKADERLNRVADRAAMRRNALNERRGGIVRVRETG
ncbi:LLM class flavin-dependent oxidoreductase [Aureimonas fodinaquatilis]|uniref:LLM class flavin-dependent oxidoreductase n=1 Tax=Aureimonas fodinaquatilis TaxID=2565783 RepID=A0A5B0DVX3_9HYPH|nr:MupA/Atu3671 family FMN-dependent luciferase-like monooxygenase [Aureimonas fodinaquatilis]KAA0970583.1 LLM class flavin-dependent oxidoreductase [Aureimonas fodinaquatilis]